MLSFSNDFIIYSYQLITKQRLVNEGRFLLDGEVGFDLHGTNDGALTFLWFSGILKKANVRGVVSLA